MIRDPSDGSVKEITPQANEIKDMPAKKLSEGITDSGPVIDTSTSGLPITKAKADYLARLEKSRQWLKEYVRSTIS